MSEKNHFAALQEIRCWNTDDVICALNYNGLSECVDACKKREITGERLLELSELTLGQWKHEISNINVRKLAAFVRDISKMPANYTACNVSSNTSDDAWDTDFDDDETEEDNSQKTENDIPQEANAERKLGVDNVSHQENGNLGVQNICNKVYNTQHNVNQLSPINKNRNSQLRNKINIPSAFKSVHPSENGSLTNSFSGKISKPPFLKPNVISEPVSNDVSREPKSTKPTIPSRPQSLLTKSSKDIVQSSLPKPPAFDKEGSVIKEICDKLQLEPEDEYDSIEEERLKYLISQYNDAGGLPHSTQQNPLENPRKSPVQQRSGKDMNQKEAPPCSSLHRNQLYISKKSNSLSQQMSKTDQNTVVENSKKSPILPPAHTKKLEELFQNSVKLPSTNQEIPRKSPIPLPPRNEKKQDISPLPILNHIPQKNSQTVNEVFTTGSSTATRLSKDYDDNKYYNANKENGSNEDAMQEQVYEYIQEHDSSKCSDIESCEYSGGYLVPKAPPSLPPKQPQASHNVKLLEKNSNAEYNAAGSSWSFGSLKHKSQQKTLQEKSSQDGKKTNTLPMPRPFISESPRPSTSRPLPPPPQSDAGVQRVVKIPLVQMPWYFNVDRTKGEEILQNCEDGTFMIRPSTKTQNSLTLTLKYGKRPFNICVRLRPDGRFALGSAKPTEQTFASVEELVKHYTTNELLLYSNGKQAGIVVLASPPRKDT